MALLLDPDYTALWDNILDILQDSTRNKTTLFLVQYAFQVTFHSVWREKNGPRHGEAPTSAIQLVKLIEKQIRNKISILRLDRTQSLKEPWRYGSFKLLI